MLRTATACILSLMCSTALCLDDQNVLYDFSATWCGPCQKVAPVVDRLHREGLPVRKVDIDQERDLAARYGIKAVPTFVLVIDGKEVERRSGYMSETDLRRLAGKIPQSSAAQPKGSMLAENQSNGPSGIDLGTPGAIQTPAGSSSETSQPAAQQDDAPSALASLNPFRKKDGTTEALVRGNDSPAGTSADGTSQKANDPMQASVRIRVFIDGKINLGSGTVIASKPGHTVILTCGHIFRNFQQDSKIEVDFIRDGKSIEHVATVEKFDTESDLGIIVVNTDQAMPVAPIAMLPHTPDVGDSVAGIGCSAGDLPTRNDIQITAIDRYEGPNNIECTGLPVQGRSGGGLFNHNAEIVGVCIAADRDRERGLYSGLHAIHQILDECHLSHLYQPATQNAPEIQFADATRPSNGLNQAQPMPSDFAATDTQPVTEIATNAPSAPVAAVQTTPAHAATPSSIPSQPVDLQAGRQEVVVIIRDPSNPEGANRVVIIHDASEKFLSYLNGELDPQSSQPQRMMSSAIQVPEVSRQLRSASDASSVVAKGLRYSGRTASLQQTSLSQSSGPQRFVRNQPRVAR
ncbi:Thioredoxin [Thalassoglobus neptunius]|uniref:Thioredoxin n=1 Tax=Thalassoglobus neptunius TaxID=1938619 RepID=A0A5C5X4U6_9PLAN|nr:thioredoxin domain-containing protein [Thalassoglobus neptunius]TWT57341.1 Thioredoxin [Thalassoglobus neptunius]